MTTLTHLSQSDERETHTTSLFLDWAVALSAALFIFGLFLDGWAHNHGKADTSLFTPWHAILYSAFTLSGALLVGFHFRNVNRGLPFMQALPRGYMLSLAGVFVFACAGVGDMIWHETFGIEQNIEALHSPTHLALGLGAFLIASGPFRAAWQRHEQLAGWKQFFPIVLSSAAMLSIMTFFTQYAYLAGHTRILVGFRPGTTYDADLTGITGTLFTTVFVGGMLLLMLRRWRLPYGAFTVMLTLNATLMIWLSLRNYLEFALLAAFISAGLVTDTLIWKLKPESDNVPGVRMIAAIMPFALTLLYLGALNWVGLELRNHGIWWHIHMWLGVPVVAALAGLLMSYLAFPPAMPEDNR